MRTSGYCPLRAVHNAARASGSMARTSFRSRISGARFTRRTYRFAIVWCIILSNRVVFSTFLNYTFYRSWAITVCLIFCTLLFCLFSPLPLLTSVTALPVPLTTSLKNTKKKLDWEEGNNFVILNPTFWIMPSKEKRTLISNRDICPRRSYDRALAVKCLLSKTSIRSTPNPLTPSPNNSQKKQAIPLFLGL